MIRGWFTSVACLAALATAALAAIDRGGITRGRLESIDPFVVAGTGFDVSQAAVRSNDVPATVDQLHAGQVVEVSSTWDDGAVALEIVYADVFRGVVEEISATDFVVLGNRIDYDASTRFAMPTLAPRPRSALSGFVPPDVSLAGPGPLLAVGQRVAVSGLRLPGGGFMASRVGPGGPGEDRLQGIAAEVADDVLFVDELEVHFGAAQLSGFDSAPADDDAVSVTGVVVAPGVFVASTMERLSGTTTGEVGDEVDLEGYVTRFVSPENFDVDGIAVRVTEDTDFDDGSADDLAEGVRVQVDGVSAGPGAPVVAEDIDFAETGESAAAGDDDG